MVCFKSFIVDVDVFVLIIDLLRNNYIGPLRNGGGSFMTSVGALVILSAGVLVFWRGEDCNCLILLILIVLCSYFSNFS